jgi:hypothetical protein
MQILIQAMPRELRVKIDLLNFAISKALQLLETEPKAALISK